MKKAVILLVIVLSLVGVMTASAKGVEDFYVDLGTLNNSGVTGTAHLHLEGDQLTVTINASGLEPGKVHPQHIHGAPTNKGNATCPTPAADANGDGFVDVGEGLPNYGPVLLNLLPFNTVAADGTLNFQQTFTVDPKGLGPLQNRAMVLHGLTVNGTYVASMPVACGQIRPLPDGPK